MKPNLSERIVFFILAVASLAFVFPYYFIIVTALKSGQDLTVNPVGLPAEFRFENFLKVFAGTGVLKSAFNSILVTAGTIALGLALFMMSSYGIYRLRNTRLGTVLFSVAVFGLMIPSVGYWQMIITYRKLFLYNSLHGVILGLVASSLPFCTLLIVGHMKTIPNDLIGSAVIDGAGEYGLFRHVIVPLSRPIIITVAVFLLVESWNNLLIPLMLLRDDSLLTLPLKLKAAFFREYAPAYELFFAGALVTSVPFVTAYVFLQKYFQYGLSGALKE